MGPNAATEIGQRHIPDEPMYLIINLGISSGFSVSAGLMKEMEQTGSRNGNIGEVEETTDNLTSLRLSSVHRLGQTPIPGSLSDRLDTGLAARRRDQHWMLSSSNGNSAVHRASLGSLPQ